MDRSSSTWKLSDLGFFVVRTPLYPLDRLKRLYRGEQIDGSFEARLLDFFQQPAAREALLIASPSLSERLGESSKRDDDARRKLFLALARYAVRMCARPTPFGLFAGVTTGCIDSHTQLQLADEGLIRHTRLDNGYLFSLGETVARLDEWRPHLRWRTNSSLYRVGEQWRYIERLSGSSGTSHKVVSVADTEYLSAVLRKAQAPQTLDSLYAVLREVAPDVDAAEISAYVAELADSQLLEPDLEPAITGDTPLAAFLERLSGIPNAEPARRTLTNVERKLRDLDLAPLGSQAEHYDAAIQELKSLPVTVDRSRIFQVDMVKSARDFTLGRSVVDHIAAAGTRLLGFTRPVSELEEFCRKFTSRYELEWVRLSELLDHDTGLGFGLARHELPLVNDLRLDTGAMPAKAPDPVWDSTVIRLAETAWRENRKEVDLESADLRPLVNRNVPENGRTCFASLSLLHADERITDKHRPLAALHFVGGRSALDFLGRFCHADRHLRDWALRTTALEQQLADDVILAEITHLPQGRAANVLLRPVLREYEIPYLGRSGAPVDRQIPIDDLLVSVRNERVVLRSRRLGKYVLPTLSCAHAFLNSNVTAHAYRFLCMVNAQGSCQFQFQWPTYMSGVSFLPRVTFQRLILRPAQWRLPSEELAKLRSSPLPTLRACLDKLRTQLDLPRWVTYPTQGDNVLSIDLESPLGAAMLASNARPALDLVVAESLLELDSPVHDSRGRYANELILPFRVVRDRLTETQSRAESIPDPADARFDLCGRTFGPGSQWIYFKLYLGAGTADRVLRETIAPVLERLRADGLLEKWFFIRYGDPDWHLRLRIRARSQSAVSRVQSDVAQALNGLLEAGVVWRNVADTYVREVERYGGPEAMTLCETYFQHDSECVLEILETLQGAEREDARWRIATYGLHRLLEDFGFTIEERRRISRELSQAQTPPNARALLRKQIARRYRDERHVLQPLILNAQSSNELVMAGVRAIAKHRRECAPVVHALRELESNGRLLRPLRDVVASLAHMFLNRLFPAEGVAHERVLYEFLHSVYDFAERNSPCRFTS